MVNFSDFINSKRKQMENFRNKQVVKTNNKEVVVGKIEALKEEKEAEIKLLSLLGKCVSTDSGKYVFELEDGRKYETSKNININDDFNEAKYRELKKIVYSEEYFKKLDGAYLNQPEYVKYVKTSIKGAKNVCSLLLKYCTELMPFLKLEEKNEIVERYKFNKNNVKTLEKFAGATVYLDYITQVMMKDIMLEGINGKKDREKNM